MLYHEDLVAVDREVKTIWPDCTLHSKIGEGVSGCVYQAHSASLQSDVAIKVIRIPNLEYQPVSGADIKKEHEGYLHEMQLWQKLSADDHFVRLYEYAVREAPSGDSWTMYAKMELLQELTTYLKQKTLTVSDAARIGIELCRALEFCESHRILHRDVKPGNVFASETGKIKLGDFGMSQYVSEPYVGYFRKGTVMFMSPEEYRAENYPAQNFSSDVYSVGLILYWLLNRRKLPFLNQGVTMEESRRLRFDGTPIPPPRDGNLFFSCIILTACAFSPDNRYHSAKALREALEKLLQGETDIDKLTIL